MTTHHESAPLVPPHPPGKASDAQEGTILVGGIRGGGGGTATTRSRLAVAAAALGTFMVMIVVSSSSSSSAAAGGLLGGGVVHQRAGLGQQVFLQHPRQQRLRDSEEEEGVARIGGGGHRLIRKTAVDAQKRLAFFFGAEGTGHHFFVKGRNKGPLNLGMGRDFCAAEVVSLNAAKAAMCEMCEVKQCQLLTKDISPELFRDVSLGEDHLYDFVMPGSGKKSEGNCVNNFKYSYHQPSNDDPTMYATMRRQTGYVSCADATAKFLVRFSRAAVPDGGSGSSTAAPSAPSYMVANGRFSYGQYQVDSYPTLMHAQYPNLPTFARWADGAGVDLRVLVMLRDPAHAMRSVLQRYGLGGRERPDNPTQRASQAVVAEETVRVCDGGVMQRAVDAYHNMSAQLRQLDPRFYTCWVYDPSYPLDKDFSGGAEGGSNGGASSDSSGGAAAAGGVSSSSSSSSSLSVRRMFDLSEGDLEAVRSTFVPQQFTLADFAKDGEAAAAASETETETMTTVSAIVSAYASLGGDAFWHQPEYVAVPRVQGIAAATTAAVGAVKLPEALEGDAAAAAAGAGAGAGAGGAGNMFHGVDYQVKHSMVSRLYAVKVAESELGRKMTNQEIGAYVRKENELYKAYWSFRSRFCGAVPVDHIGL